ncbi:MAG: helix-turn-helix domain-containing protein [Clostridia bacterium]|nr:helix-turn-helix domain-containing protein [Clostridia bacterium]
MAAINEIYNSICFIEKNLKEPITVMDAAKSIGYSIFYFSRVFNAFTGHNPYDYIIRRRLSEAAKIIRQNDEKITDIAFEYQFNNLETFSRAFKRMFGLTPNKYKTDHHICKTAIKSPSNIEYLIHINTNNFFTPSLVEIKQLNLVGEIKELSGKKARLHPSGRHSHIIAHEPHTCGKDILKIAFSQVHSLENIPDNSIGKTIPALSCIEFNHVSGNIEFTYEYIFQTWIPLSPYSFCKPYSIEFLGANSPSASDGYLPLKILIPVQKV